MKFGKESKLHLGGYITESDIGDPNTYATEVWDWMIKNGINSVIDIGCGEGHSTKYFLDNGIHCLGVEGGELAYNNSQCKKNVILHDYTEGPYIPNQRFDAVWSCEFVEHVEEQYLDNFLSTFKSADRIFMTHAVPGQEGYHHVNCQPSEYWINKIEKLGYKFQDSLSTMLRELTDKMHVKNTLLVFYKDRIQLNTERMKGFGEYKLDGYQVNYLYGLDEMCRMYLTPNSEVLELGVNRGISTTLFSEYCKRVIAVDFVKTQEVEELITQKNNVTFFEMSFSDYLKSNENLFDLIYIDGSHQYEDVKNDITMCLKFLKKGGVISGHDYNSETPGVIQAVNELLKEVEVFSDSSWAKRIN